MAHNLCFFFSFLFLKVSFYIWAGHLTARSDVYSFGVVLLELLTGRRSVDKTRPSKEQNLVDWARPKLTDKRKMLQIVDPRLENQYSVRAAQKACSLAYYCLSQNPKARPLMSDVVETLEPLQSTSDAAELSPLSISSSGPFGRVGIPDYRTRQRLNNVGPGSSCRSPNPNCSPGGLTACRVRWESSWGTRALFFFFMYTYFFLVCFYFFPLYRPFLFVLFAENGEISMSCSHLVYMISWFNP